MLRAKHNSGIASQLGRSHMQTTKSSQKKDLRRTLQRHAPVLQHTTNCPSSAAQSHEVLRIRKQRQLTLKHQGLWSHSRTERQVSDTGRAGTCDFLCLHDTRCLVNRLPLQVSLVHYVSSNTGHNVLRRRTGSHLQSWQTPVYQTRTVLSRRWNVQRTIQHTRQIKTTRVLPPP